MTVDEALAALRQEFGEPDDKTMAANQVAEICSGGEPVRVDDENQTPALCATRELAAALWLVAVQAWLREQKPSSWTIADGPHLDKFFITIMDSRKTQRTASDRYAVTAKVAIAWATPKTGD